MKQFALVLVLAMMVVCSGCLLEEKVYRDDFSDPSLSTNGWRMHDLGNGELVLHNVRGLWWQQEDLMTHEKFLKLTQNIVKGG